MAGVDVRTRHPVDRLRRSVAEAGDATKANGAGATPRWAVGGPAGTIDADAVVLAVPAGVAAGLLAPLDGPLGEQLRAIAYGDVTIVTLRLADDAVGRPLDGTGFLVPAESGRLVTASTWLSSKWPQLRRPGEVLLRASMGRYGDDRAALLSDDEVVAHAVAELRDVLALRGGPLASLVTRWPGSFPQYAVGHLERVDAIEAAVARHPGLALGGGALRGVGIPACIGSGRRAPPWSCSSIWAPCRSGCREQHPGRRHRRARPRRGVAVCARAAAVGPPGGQRRRGRSAGRVPGRVLAPAFLSGVGLALSLPPWGFWILAFPAAALLWWRLAGLRMRTRFLAGWVAGLGLFVPGLWWVASFNVYGGVVLWLVESLAPALACAVVARQGRGRTVVLAGAMVLVEALRGTWPFGGLPLGGVALGQAAGPLAGAARLGGPLLLVGLVWLGGGGLGALAVTATRYVAYRRELRRTAEHQRSLAESRARIEPDDAYEDRLPLRALAAAARRVRPPRPVRVLGPVLGAAAALVVVVGIGCWGAAAPDGGPALTTIRVASVQGGGVRGLRQAEVDPGTVYAAQVAATAEIPDHDGGTPPTLIVWPEDVVDLCLRPRPVAGAGRGRRHRVGRPRHLGRGSHRERVGHPVPQRGGGLRPVGPGGGARFEKVHRVPFGEYIPYRGFSRTWPTCRRCPVTPSPGTATACSSRPRRASA